MYCRCEKSRTSGRGTDGIAKGDHTRVAIGNISSTRGGAQLLEFSRRHDCSGRYRIQSRAGYHSVEDEARFTAAFALQPSGCPVHSEKGSRCGILAWHESKDIEIAVSQCPVCEETSPALPKEKLLVHEILGKPWEKVGMDLFRIKGKDYLIVVDYLTDFFKFPELPDLSGSSVVQAAKQQFAHHGIPVWVHSDGGSQFAAREFSVFSHAWGFEHTLSSPYNSQSNGKAELAVKIAKKLWKRSKDPYLALLEWRNTPTVGMGSSPC